ncbi:MAG: N-acetylmuramoyl-L-alanine amidase [bacterium]|nr:N-acetylmuramoyl-L-alanine amidase [bacterium]
MIRRPADQASFGFPAAAALVVLLLLFSSPLHSKMAPDALPTLRFAQGACVPVAALCKSYGFTANPTPENHKLTLSLAGRSVVLTRYSSAIKIDQEMYRMPGALFFHAGDWYLPTLGAEYIAKQFNLTPNFAPPTQSVTQSAWVETVANPPGDLNSKVQESQKKDLTKHAASWKLKTVVIDPGHGGKDPGAVGTGGTLEKTIVLEVARQLKSLLEKELKVNVVLTRSDDTFIPLGRRSRIAIQQEGKVFVSLHCNATQNRDASGIEVYFLSEAKTKDAALVAQTENAVLEKYEGVSADSLSKDLDRIRYGLLSSQFLIESQDLAADIHSSALAEIPGTVPRGVKQANFYVMRGTMGHMPSVLVELGFVTHREEEKQLKSKARQKQLAKALYEGIRKFKLRYEQQLTTDSS